MRQKALVGTIGRYLTTTTLHGFKYLTAQYYSDRIGWAVSCCASACCSGVLCAVLWSRFVQSPTLLALGPVDVTNAMPSLGVCFSLDLVAQRVIRNIGNDSLELSQALANVLRGKSPPEYRLSYIEHLLKMKGLSFQEAMLESTPPCSELFNRCRVDNKNVDCGKIVNRGVTLFGACCTIIIPKSSARKRELHKSIKVLEFVLNNTDEQQIPVFDFITSEGSVWEYTGALQAGYIYDVPLKFQSIVSSSAENVIDGSCIGDEDYSLTGCRAECAERSCGCSGALIHFDDDEQEKSLKSCSLAEIVCLRTLKIDPSKCNCLPPCKQVQVVMSLMQYRLDAGPYVWRPFYDNLSPETSIVLSMVVETVGSHVLERLPTETWLTLLSSLGGVFNMFLGVGFFSALELFFFLVLRMPLAIRKSMEMKISSAVNLPTEGVT